MAFFNLH